MQWRSNRARARRRVFDPSAFLHRAECEAEKARLAAL